MVLGEASSTATSPNASRVMQEQAAGTSSAAEEASHAAPGLPPELAALVMEPRSELGLFPPSESGLSASDEEFQQDASLIDPPTGGVMVACNCPPVQPGPCTAVCSR